ncbi:MAG: class I SAM-dependent RNA methyltransferase [Flavobacteriia bacterium]|nr:class I SAM-dependent RNA methyltransferase [Flavobacteriia bacterium]
MINGANNQDENILITLKTLFGFEEVLKEELNELGYDEVKILNRAVQIYGTWRDVYFLNLYCRCCISILVEIEKFFIRDEKDLYKKCMKIDWSKYFDVQKTFAVKGAVFSDLFSHTQYPFLVVKDAICDVFRDKDGIRPDVNIKTPQILFDVYINKQNVIVSLNTSGAPLFQRGYRQAVGDAPLNEVAAAGLIRMSGWDRKSMFVDPFCGSGTLLIEAALLASGIPSNIERQHYAFKNFANYDAKVWEEIYENAPKRASSLPCKIVGSDISSEMVLKARRNLGGLPIGRFVEVENLSFEELKNPVEAGVMVTNPPYGERMGEDIEELYSKLGDWMKAELKGYTCWIISSSEDGFKNVGLRPERKIKLFNGDLECSFRKYSIYDGSKKGKYLNSEEEG